MGAPCFFSENGRIEVCGGIASGKTTLTQLLSQLEIPSVFESFQSNPFWKAFYADPIGTAFETEITFLLQHYHEIKTAAKQNKPFTCDFSPLLDLAYAKVTLDDRKREAFTAVYREIQTELPAPNLVIQLVCDPEVEIDRIKRRGRDVEQSITVDYLAALDQALAEVLRDEAKPLNILTLDSATIDFAHDEAGRQTVIEAVCDRLAHTFEF